MKMLRILALCLVALVASTIVHAQSGTIHGVLRDDEGMPLPGVKITLVNAQTSKIVAQTSSGAKGEYRLVGLTVEQYVLSTEVGVAKSISIAHESDSQEIDLSQHWSTPAAKGTQPPPKFEAAGVRGLIDPGGYSAPANAAAASGLIAGVADIKRTGRDIHVYSAKDWPCGMETELTNVVHGNPQSVEANRRLGEFYIAHDQAAQSILFLLRAHRLAPSDYASSLDLSIAWLKTGQFDAARDLLITMAAYQSKPEIHQLMARALEGTGKFHEAAEQYQIALQQNPSEEIYFGVGYDLILAGAVPRATSAFREGIQQFPHSVTLHIGMGTAEFLGGHATQAIQYFLQATDLQPTDSRPYACLASVPSTSGADIGATSAAFKPFHELAPGSAEANYYYALNLWDHAAQRSADEMRSIETLLLKPIQLDPQLATAHFKLAILYAERDDYIHAIPEYEAALRFSPS